MNVQSINSISKAAACQPLKPVSFAGKDKAPSFAKEVFTNDLVPSPVTSPFAGSKDSFNPQMNAEDKFDMACLVAGYYKTQYENLLEKGDCIA